MSFFESVNKRQLLIESLQKRKLLLGPESFNNISDYYLLRRYIKRVSEFFEISDYIVAKVIVKVPIRSRWYYENEEKEKKLERYLIIGLDENDSIVVFYSDILFHCTNYDFGFTVDLARFDNVNVEQFMAENRFFRVQGDIVLNIEKVENVVNAYLNSLYNDSLNLIENLMGLEVHRRVSDIFTELSMTTVVSPNEVRVRGCPSNLKIDKVVSYVSKNIILSDIFPFYELVFEEENITNNPFNRLLLRSKDNEFYMSITSFIQHRNERELVIRIDFEHAPRTNKLPLRVFFENLVEESKLVENISEQEIEERVGRHIITFKNAYPRGVTVEREFPISHRRYNIALSTHAYVTNGTEITLSHPQHGTKTVRVPASRIWIRHVTQPYRTVEIKNLLLLRHYFT